MLTRVKKAWLQEKKDTAPVCYFGEDLKDLHNMHHFGKERTLYLARKVNSNITMEAVKKVVEQCRECQSIDPAPSRHEKGTACGRKFEAAGHWYHALSPSTVPIHDWLWTWESSDMAKNQNRDSERVVEEVFLERWPVEEVLIDNGVGFHS